MQSAVLTTAQSGCVAFYNHRRDHGTSSEHQHDAHQISITDGGPLNVRWWSANRGEQRFVAADGNIIVNPARELGLLRLHQGASSGRLALIFF